MADILIIIVSIINTAVLFLFISLSYIIYNLKFLTKGFKKVWNSILIGFSFIILGIIYKLFTLFLNKDILNPVYTDNLVLPIFLLLASLFFIKGFHKLYLIFSEISAKKVFPYQEKKDSPDQEKKIEVY